MTTNTDQDQDATTREAPAADEHPDERAALAARLERLAAENERLRREYRRATQVTYRKTAFALAALGVLALGGAAAFPATATVFIALGAVGLFGGALTYYLTPERVLAASVGQHVHDATRATIQGIVDELGLQDDTYFLPTSKGVREFRPQHPASERPADPDRVFVVSDDPRAQGVALIPAGEGLYEEFERGLAGPLADDPAAAANQFAEAVVEQFELAAALTADATGGRVIFGVGGPAITPLADTTHPIPSFLGTGLARVVNEPVAVTIENGDGRYDTSIVATWTPED